MRTRVRLFAFVATIALGTLGVTRVIMAVRLSSHAPKASVLRVVASTDGPPALSERTTRLTRDPFRLAGRLDPPYAAQAPAPRDSVRSIPAIVVKSISGGPPWLAVISGVPDLVGDLVVRPGDALGAITVSSVGASGISLTTRDTTWHITFKDSTP